MPDNNLAKKEKLETQKKGSIIFRSCSSKINKGDGKVERPRSACLLARDRSCEKKSKERPRSWEPLRGRTKVYANKHGDKFFEVRECCCGQGNEKYLEFESGSFGDWRYPEPQLKNNGSWTPFRYIVRSGRKCRSDPSGSRLQTNSKILNTDNEMNKVKRTLKHLGFQLSDFGIFPHRTDLPLQKTVKKPSVLSTRITDRSISLDSLRSSIKRAWMEDALGETHRNILAKAAYEEWYFRKEQEMWEKKKKETKLREKAKENLEKNFLLKKEKCEEEFQKWLKKKSIKKIENKGILKQSLENELGRVKKTKEESDRAFNEWKKRKEKEIALRKEEEKKEKKQEIESKKEKSEKKVVAEKAFQQWKSKLEEAEKSEEVKKKLRLKEKQAKEERRKRQEMNEICFEKWKAAKDELVKRRIKEIREAERILREERQSQMEERMYEAEQAFEDWLEKIDFRKQKQSPGCRSYEKLVPWIPA